MKKFTKTAFAHNGGGVLALSAILAFSLTFASCANNSDSDGGENPSPALPTNVGENPIKETIKLKINEDDDYYLKFKTDGTASEIYVDDDDKNNVEETLLEYKYTYNASKNEIYIVLEKIPYSGFSEKKAQLLTYSECYSKIDKDTTVENMREYRKEYYKERKDEESFKEDYPDCDTYEKYEAAFLKENGFDSFNAYVEYEKQFSKNYCKAAFGAQITYAYETDDDGKMTLTEKFTGVKNLFDSECYFDEGSSHAYISCYWAFIEDDGAYSGSVDTDKKTINFKSEDGEKVTTTYTENTSAGTVTINFKDKKYICKFEGRKYIQVE